MAAARDKPFRSGWLIWAIGATLIVSTLLGSGAVIWNMHGQIIEEQRQAVRNLGVVLAEQTLRYVQVVDLVLQEMQARVAGAGVHAPGELADKLDAAALRSLLRDRLKNLPQANAFVLLNADGRQLVTSRAQQPENPDFSDRRPACR